MVILVVVIGSREAVRKRVGAPAALGRPYVRGRARRVRLSPRRRADVEAGSSIWTKSLVSNASWRGANGESSVAVRADRRELDDDPLVALDERVDEQLVGPGLELEVLERVDVEA